MYLHLGQNTVVDTEQLLGVFDLDNSTVSKHTRDFLARAQKEGRVVNVSMELPKSFVVCRDKEGETVYLSQLSSATLLRRSQERLSLDG
ncbi:MAG TPA: DUF370 domain-containing protein [Candidatus Acutalibacter stercorigallinarum]|nr:DUF370 domain-containing protein [Candidatus Acutalibacter stercorigallinarum]